MTKINRLRLKWRQFWCAHDEWRYTDKPFRALECMKCGRVWIVEDFK